MSHIKHKQKAKKGKKRQREEDEETQMDNTPQQTQGREKQRRTAIAPSSGQTPNNPSTTATTPNNTTYTTPSSSTSQQPLPPRNIFGNSSAPDQPDLHASILAKLSQQIATSEHQTARQRVKDSLPQCARLREHTAKMRQIVQTFETSAQQNRLESTQWCSTFASIFQSDDDMISLRLNHNNWGDFKDAIFRQFTAQTNVLETLASLRVRQRGDETPIAYLQRLTQEINTCIATHPQQQLSTMLEDSTLTPMFMTGLHNNTAQLVARFDLPVDKTILQLPTHQIAKQLDAIYTTVHGTRTQHRSTTSHTQRNDNNHHRSRNNNRTDHRTPPQRDNARNNNNNNRNNNTNNSNGRPRSRTAPPRQQHNNDKQSRMAAVKDKLSKETVKYRRQQGHCISCNKPNFRSRPECLDIRCPISLEPAPPNTITTEQVHITVCEPMDMPELPAHIVLPDTHAAVTIALDTRATSSWIDSTVVQKFNLPTEDGPLITVSGFWEEKPMRVSLVTVDLAFITGHTGTIQCKVAPAHKPFTSDILLSGRDAQAMELDYSTARRAFASKITGEFHSVEHWRQAATNSNACYSVLQEVTLDHIMFPLAEHDQVFTVHGEEMNQDQQQTCHICKEPLQSTNLDASLSLGEQLCPNGPQELIDVVNQHKEAFDPTIRPLQEVPEEQQLHLETKPGAIHNPLPPRRITQTHKKYLKSILDTMEQLGHIRKGYTPYSAPAFLVKKAPDPVTGQERFRLVIDFRALNAILVDNLCYIPSLREITSMLDGDEWLSFIDFTDAYYRIPLHKDSQHLCGITTPFGAYIAQVAMMGMRPSAAAFQQLIMHTFSHIDRFGSYVDDGLLHTAMQQQMATVVREVLSTAIRRGMPISAKKSAFGVTHGDFIGFHLSRGRIFPQLSKVQAIQTIPPPVTTTQLRRFVGMLRYLEPICRNLSVPLATLEQATAGKPKRQQLSLDHQQLQHFQEAKSLISNITHCYIPKENDQHVVMTDGSDTGLGAVLMVERQDKLYPCQWWSRSLKGAETRYPTHEKELLALTKSIASPTGFRYNLLGKRFKAFVDSKALTKLQTGTFKLSARVMRQAQLLSQFSFDIIHIAGETNTLADILSRESSATTPQTEPVEWHTFPWFNSTTEQEEIEVTFPATESPATVNDTNDTNDLLERIRNSYSETSDPLLCKIIQQISDSSSAFKWQRKLYSFDDGILYQQLNSTRVPVIPNTDNIRHELFTQYHTTFHRGRDATYAALAQRVYWPAMYNDVAKWVSTCDTCQRVKASNHKPIGHHQPTVHTTTTPATTIAVDRICGLPTAGKQRYNAALSITCIFTGYTMFLPAKQTDKAETTAQTIIDRWICLFGVPHTVISDNALEFTGTTITSIKHKLGIKTKSTPAHDARPNAYAERTHRNFNQMLQSLSEKDKQNWPKHLPMLQHCYNTAVSATRAAAPATIMFGFQPRSISDAIAAVPTATFTDLTSRDEQMLKSRHLCRQVLNEAAAAAAERINQRRSPSDDLAVGDWVLLSAEHITSKMGKANIPKKLKHKRVGPFRVKERSDRQTGVTYTLELPPEMNRFVNLFRREHLTRYLLPTPEQGGEAPAITYINDTNDIDTLYEVDEIVGHRFVDSELQLLVAWKGFPIAERTYEPAAHLAGAEEEIHKYIQHLQQVVSVLQQQTQQQ